MGDNTIHYEGHVRMMGAVQPFLSGAISKTVNMPEEATVDDVEALHELSWELGLKAVAIYRDNCKVGQPLSTAKKDDGRATRPSATTIVEQVVEKIVHRPLRQKLPRSRRGRTFEFRVADCKGFATIGEYEDGRPGEIFLTVSKQGSTLSGIMDAFAKSISYGLQYGVPLRAFVEAFTNMRFEPAGMTDDPDIRFATLDHGLPVPPPGDRVLERRGAGRAEHLHRRRADAADAARRRRDGDRDLDRLGDRRPIRSRCPRPASWPTSSSSARRHRRRSTTRRPPG